MREIEFAERAVGCLGRGFDLTSDFRLKYSKGEDSLLLINGSETADLCVPGFGVCKGVSVDVKCDKGDCIRYQSDVLEFHKMSSLFNQLSSVPGKIPSGFFNQVFGLDGWRWAKDVSETRCLAFDGYFISLFNLRLDRSPLTLRDEVRKAVPSAWDPRALARFIEMFGTHIIVGLSMGGQDVVSVRVDKSSNLEASDIKEHLDKLGDQLFTGTCTLSPHHGKKTKDCRNKFPRAFNIFDQQPVLMDSISYLPVTKDGITVIWSKKGGDAMAQSHSEWLLTVPSKPDVTTFTLVPITSLLSGTPGKGFLSHAISLYLRYKPPISDLDYFLAFQCQKKWAPLHSELPLGPLYRKAQSNASLQFNLMGPKLNVNTSQVIVGCRPVTGMRLYLEGRKCDRLAIHIEHLSTTPAMLIPNSHNWSAWRRSEDNADVRYLEPVQWKKLSHVCTAPVKYDTRWASEPNTVFIVAGAQLQVTANVLHLSLLFAKLSNCSIFRSVWEHGSTSDQSHRSSLLSNISMSLAGSVSLEKEKQLAMVVVDSGVFPIGPPAPAQAHKHLKFVDTSQVCKGAQDSPGHWLVTAARLDLERRKICLNLKFSLLTFHS